MHSGAPLREVLIKGLDDSAIHREVGGRPLLEVLVTAVNEGRLEWTGGRLAPPAPRNPRCSPWIPHDPERIPERGARHHYPPCWFLDRVLFRVVYERGAVPLACRHCYKVKVEVDTLAELVALREQSLNIPYPSKCGAEVDQPLSRSRWSAYFYLDGLEAAFEVHRRVRERIDGQPALRDARSSIKRGCTHFEMALGPSDQWSFDESLGELERALLPLCGPPDEPPLNKHASYLGWFETAFRIGDDSYLQLNGGKRVYPPTVDYLARGE